MSTLQTFTFPWPELDHARLEKVIKKVAKRFEGVVVTQDPDAVDPDREELGNDDLDEEGDEEDDEEDEFEWSFGFPVEAKGKKGGFAWASIDFRELEEDEDEGTASCRGSFGRDDYDPRCEDEFFDLVEQLAEELGGKVDEI